MAAPAAAPQTPQAVPVPSAAGPPLVYDEKSGYFYDPRVGYYFVPASQNYYDGQTGRYYSWDGATLAYVPVMTEAEAAEAQAKKAKSIEAKRVAKDMERWEKKRKKVEPVVIRKGPSGTSGGFKAVGADSSSDATVSTVPGFELPPEALQLLEAQQPDADAWAVAQARGHVDLEKVACLLCKRGLASAEKLEKHCRASKVHLESLAAERERVLAALSTEQHAVFDERERALKYRDRAAERREQYNQPENPVKEAKAARKRAQAEEAAQAAAAAAAVPAAPVQSAKAGLGAENKGYAMLQKQGWRAGEGLGKDGGGRVAPVLPESRVKGAGIGAAPAFEPNTSESYEQNTKAMARARFNAL